MHNFSFIIHRWRKPNYELCIMNYKNMFFSRTTTIAKSGVLCGFTDWHCHLLPGVDDGSRTMDETLRILASYGERGVSEVWLTPHVMEDMPNTTAGLRERFQELREAYKGGIVLHLASENMLDNLFEERLTAGDLLPIGPEGRHLLVETSYFNPPMGLDDILNRIKSRGYFPVLAHPERYMYMDEDEYKRLRSTGVMFQLNLPSIAGMYGSQVRKKAEWLLRNGLYDLTGTDTHRLRAWEMAVTAKVSKKMLGIVPYTANSL